MYQRIALRELKSLRGFADVLLSGLNCMLVLFCIDSSQKKGAVSRCVWRTKIAIHFRLHGNGAIYAYFCVDTYECDQVVVIKIGACIYGCLFAMSAYYAYICMWHLAS